MGVLVIISFLLFCVMLYIGLRFINGLPLIPDFLTRQKSMSPKTTLSKQKIDPNAIGYAVFDSEDLYNKRIYDYEGNLINYPHAPLKSEECADYVYRDAEGKCSAVKVSGYIDDSKNSKLCDDTKSKEENKNCIQAANVCNVSLSAAQLCPFK